MIKSYLLPPAWFPPVLYFVFVSAAHEVVIEVQDTYPKQTLRNRCTILTAHGPLNLTIPVSKPVGSKTKTDEIRTHENKDWPNKHWRAIQSAYNKSPYFIHYSETIKEVIFSNQDKITELCLQSIESMLSILKINANITFTSEFKTINPTLIDARNFDQFSSALSSHEYPEYTQVFSDRLRFQPNLSIIDLVSNLGPKSASYISRIAELIQDKQF